MNRQRLLLTGLAGALVLSIVYAYWAMPRQEAAPPRSAGPAAKGAAAPKKPAVSKTQPASGRLHLELLNVAPQPLPVTGRDIFRFRGGWAPVAAVPELVAPPTVAPPPPPPPPPTPEQLLRQALAGYKVLGYLDKGGARSVFLADDREVYVVKAGKSFGTGNRFIVTEIAATELVIATADRTVTVRLPLGESGTREPAVMSPVSVPRAEVEPLSAGNRAGRRLMNPFATDGGAVPTTDVPQREEGLPGDAPVGMEAPGDENGEKE